MGWFLRMYRWFVWSFVQGFRCVLLLSTPFKHSSYSLFQRLKLLFWVITIICVSRIQWFILTTRCWWCHLIPIVSFVALFVTFFRTFSHHILFLTITKLISSVKCILLLVNGDILLQVFLDLIIIVALLEHFVTFNWQH